MDIQSDATPQAAGDVQARAERYKWMRPLLACPACHGGLEDVAQGLFCPRCGRTYPLHQGRPVFIAEPDTVQVKSPDHISHQCPPEVAEWLAGLGGPTLNVGAGGSLQTIPGCVEMEYSLFRNTDVAADAHHLPFRDAAFDAVISFNTFEHLHDPLEASAEIYRVLRPGGSIVIQSAYLQPLHEAPFHFYGATEFGMRHWFRQFEIESCDVAGNFNPAFTLSWLCSELLRAFAQAQDEAGRQELAASTVGEWASRWADPAQRGGPLWDRFFSLPQPIQRPVAAGFALTARKSGAPDPTQA